MKIILASNSPRRREILTNFGFEVTVVPSAEERPAPENLTPFEKVAFLALEKGLDAEREYSNFVPVVSADTVVVVDGEILGKPKNREDAVRMLTLLSGRAHTVLTSFTLFYKGERISKTVSTEVVFYPLEKSDIEWYVNTGEGFDKAGAYGLQGLGAVLVEKISGDYLNVVGFPLAEFFKEYRKMQDAKCRMQN